MKICEQCGYEQSIELDYCYNCGSPISQLALNKERINEEVNKPIPFSAFLGYLIWIPLTLISPVVYYISKNTKIVSAYSAEMVSLIILIIGFLFSLVCFFGKNSQDKWITVFGALIATIIIGIVLYIYLAFMMILTIGK